VIDDPVVISAGIAAIATIIVAFVSRAGKKMADAAPLAPPLHDGAEHHHTRGIAKAHHKELIRHLGGLERQLRDAVIGLHRRLDAIDDARGAEREQEQRVLSARRLRDGKDGGETA
jgi:hypothetical protein